MSITRRDLLWGAGTLAAAAGSGIVGHLASGCPPPTPDENRRLPTRFAVAPTLIRLDRNESPYGPSPRVIATMDSIRSEDCCRWPDDEAQSLRATLAETYDADPDRIILGAGSTDIMRDCAAVFLGPGKNLVMAVPGFDRIADYARAGGATVEGVPLDRSYQQDLATILRRVTPTTGMVYLSNPFNPTGTLLRHDQLAAFLKELPSTVVLLVDEAYIEYASWPGDINPSLVADSANHPRLVVTRTFSKIYGMAGLRVGYAFAGAEAAQRLRLGGAQQGLGTRSINAALTALTDRAYTQAVNKLNDDARQEFVNQSTSRMLQPVGSEANFILLFIDDCLGIAGHFIRHGIRVAANYPNLSQSIRVTLGTPDQMMEFWRVFDLNRALRPF